jgi:hypothetical protein
MNPYDIDVEGLKESAEIKDEKELLKLRLTAEFLRITAKMPTDEVLAKTGLHKSDLSRLRTFSLSRFTIDRIITLLDVLGVAPETVSRWEKGSLQMKEMTEKFIRFLILARTAPVIKYDELDGVAKKPSRSVPRRIFKKERGGWRGDNAAFPDKRVPGNLIFASAGGTFRRP